MMRQRLLPTILLLGVATTATAPRSAHAESVPDAERAHEASSDLTLRARLGRARITATPWAAVTVNTVYNTGTGFPTSEAPVGAVVGSGFGELATDGNFLISARQTRFGLNGTIETDGPWDVRARLEMDFFGLHEKGGPTAAVMAAPRMRFATVSAGTEHVRFHAGQDMVVFTPRLPTSVGRGAVAVHTFSGAIWNRLPQMGIELKLSGEHVRFRPQLAAARPHSGDGTGEISRFEAVEPGLAGGLPFAQGRVSVALADLPIELEVGLGGHWGRERWEVTTGVDGRPGYRFGELLTREQNVETWMASVDLRVAAGGAWLQGQGFLGANLNGMFSRQGVAGERWTPEEALFADAALAGRRRTVRAAPVRGGWIELGLPTGVDGLHVVSSLGGEFGDEDVVDWNAPTRSTGVFGSLQYTPVGWLGLSAEYLRSETRFRPDLAFRDRLDTDPLQGGLPPLRERAGFNHSFSLNTRLSF